MEGEGHERQAIARNSSSRGIRPYLRRCRRTGWGERKASDLDLGKFDILHDLDASPAACGVSGSFDMTSPRDERKPPAQVPKHQSASQSNSRSNGQPLDHMSSPRGMPETSFQLDGFKHNSGLGLRWRYRRKQYNREHFSTCIPGCKYSGLGELLRERGSRCVKINMDCNYISI
jgi:hypothetical protein